MGLPHLRSEDMSDEIDMGKPEIRRMRLPAGLGSTEGGAWLNDAALRVLEGALRYANDLSVSVGDGKQPHSTMASATHQHVTRARALLEQVR